MSDDAPSQSVADTLMFLIAQGIDVYARDDVGNTPLHAAARIGNVEAVRALLAAGADLHARNLLGETALHTAVGGNSDNRIMQLPFGFVSHRCTMVWDELQSAHEVEMAYGEETITDNLCLALRAAKLHGLEVHKVSKRVEGDTGVDIELYVGNPKDGWWSYFIQAKRVEVVPERYLQVLHRRRKDGRRQFDLLEAHAATAKAIPLYAFYNYVMTDITGDLYHCPLPSDKSLLGWTIAPIDTVRPFVYADRIPTFKEIHTSDTTLPARCLLCGRIAAIGQIADHPLRNDASNAVRLTALPSYIKRINQSDDAVAGQSVGQWIIVASTAMGMIDCTSILTAPGLQ